MGFPYIDEDEEIGLQGRVSNLSAENVWADCKWKNNNLSNISILFCLINN